MAKDWLKIRVKTEAPKFDAVRSKIMGWPEEVAKEVYWPALRAIGQEGVDYMRYIILTAPNKTKEDGRFDTGTMHDRVTTRARERKDGFSLFTGWVDGRPGYSIFQELGTKNGIVGMNAVGQAQEYMLSQLRALAAGRYTGSDADSVSFDD